MSYTDLFDRYDDLLNPVLVKELRQSTHSRVVMGMMVFFMFLLFCLLTMGAAGFSLITIGIDEGGIQAGKTIFIMNFTILLFFCIAFLPAYMAFRTSAEFGSSNFDLNFITTMTPSAIIAGKTMAGAVMAFLFFSTSLPYMVMTQILRGIDIYSILILQALAFFLIIPLIQFGITVACIPCSRFFRGIIWLLSAGVLFISFSMICSTGFYLLDAGVTGYIFSNPDFIYQAVFFLFCYIAVTLILHVLATAIISPQSSNRIFPVRMIITSMLAIAFVIALCGDYMVKSNNFREVFLALSAIVISAAILGSVSERDEISKRVRCSISKKVYRRVSAFFFYQGGAGGFILYLTAAICIYAVSKFSINSASGSRSLDNICDSFLIFVLYHVSYAQLGLLARRSFSRLKNLNHVTWIAALVFLCLFNIAPFLLVTIFSGKTVNIDSSDKLMYWLIFFGNPYHVSFSMAQDFTKVIAAAAALLILSNWKWFIARIKYFFLESDDVTC